MSRFGPVYDAHIHAAVEAFLHEEAERFDLDIAEAMILQAAGYESRLMIVDHDIGLGLRFRSIASHWEPPT